MSERLTDEDLEIACRAPDDDADPWPASLVRRLAHELRERRAASTPLNVVCAQFRDAVSAANRANAQRGRGGQQVPFHGDFCSAPPSVLVQLTRWAREMEDADAPLPHTADLTPDEVEALRWLRSDSELEGKAHPGTQCTCASCARHRLALATLDRLLAGAK